jgi:transcriptional regulator with XRE-family HTH domain
MTATEIRQELKARKITQKQLATALNVSPSTISRALSGKAPKQLEKIVAYLAPAKIAKPKPAPTAKLADVIKFPEPATATISLVTSLVSVKRVVAATPREAFNPAAIDAAVATILSLGCSIRPLLIERIDIRNFRLADESQALWLYACQDAYAIARGQYEVTSAYIVDGAVAAAVSQLAA